MTKSGAPSLQTTTMGVTSMGEPTSTRAMSAAITGAPRAAGGPGGGAMGITASDISLSRTRVAVLSPSQLDELAPPGMHFASLAAPWAGSFSVGAAIGYALPARHSLTRTRDEGDQFRISDQEIFWFDSLLLLGAVFGSMCGCFVAHYIGRRRTLVVACVGSLFSWLAIAGASAESFHLLMARVIGGLCTGMISLATPAYIAETAAAKDRGKMCGAHQTGIAAGVLLIYVAGRYVEWPGLAVLCGLPPALAVLLLCLAVDSPRWLIQHGKREEALNALRILRDTTAQADAEFEEIEAIFRNTPTPLAHYMMAVLVMVIQQFSGVNAVILYASGPVYAGIASSSHDAFILLASVQLVVTATAAHMLDALGRLKPLAVSVVVSTGSVMALASIYFGMSSGAPSGEMNLAAGLAVFCKVVFTIGFSVGLGPATWCLAVELSPLRGNGFEFGSVCAFHWASALAITTLFSILGTTPARLALLICFSSAVAFAGGVTAFNLLPDTRRVSLETILITGQGERSRRPSDTRHSAAPRSSSSRRGSARDEQKERRTSKQYKSQSPQRTAPLSKGEANMNSELKAKVER